MTLYTVHLPEGHEGDDRLLRAVLVKDGFHWLAFVLPLVWLLVQRIWWGALAYVAATVALVALAELAGLPEPVIAALGLLIGLFVGSVAPDLLGWQLGRRGYHAVDVASGRDEEEALRRFLDRTTGPASTGPAPTPPATDRPVPRTPVGLAPAPVPVIGLFPDAGGRT